MKHCRKTVGLLVTMCVLMPAGCASQRARFAKKHEVNTAQLLAAARQYEKEGQAENAAHIYQHVLKYHPTSTEARHGLALVRQGKLRVDYDTQRLLASTDPAIQKNPQAREMLTRQQKSQKEQAAEQMAQLIASAAKNPHRAEAVPTPASIASHAVPTPAPQGPARQADAKPVAPNTHVQGPQLVILEPMTLKHTQSGQPTKIAQADAITDEQPGSTIETTAFTNSRATIGSQGQVPADWSADSPWRPHSLSNLCRDANAAVLAEVEKLDSHVDEIRKEGLTNLAHMGTQAASAGPAVRRLLADNNQVVAAHAAWATWEVERDATAVVEPLAELLTSPNTDVVQFAAYTLSSIGQPAASATARLRKLLGHQESITRLHAAEALIHVAGPAQRGEAVDTLIILLKDENWEVRNLAAMMLGVADAENAEFAVASLLSALDDEDDRVRSAAALSLGAYGSKADFAVRKLEELAQQDHTDVREAARTALSCISL